MAPNLIVFALPVFLLMIIGEALWCHYRQKPYYRYNDSLNDVSLGICEQVISTLIGGLLFAGYLYIYTYHRLFELSNTSPWVWVSCFVLKDFFYYWAHRMSHEINLLWAGHAPHHQSEEYNLTVALRQGVFQGPLTCYFFWPIALLGYPPEVYLVASQLNTIYQFWVHTRAVKRLGWADYIFCTPSNHRVHHAKNPKYLDKNHGGFFIIWDRMFGTFQDEEEEPTYGTIEPLKSWNPVWAEVKYLVYLAKLGWASPRWADFFRVWFKRGGWTPERGDAVIPPDEQIRATPRYETRSPLGLNVYAGVHFAGALGLAVPFLMFSKELPLQDRVLAAAVILLAIMAVGAAFEGRRWLKVTEPVRFGLTAFLGWKFLGPAAAGGVLVLGIVSLIWLSRFWTRLRNPAFVLPDNYEALPVVVGA